MLQCLHFNKRDRGEQIHCRLDAALRLPGAGRNPQNRREAADADAIFGAISPEVLHAAHRLKWAQVYSAGCKILMGPEIADHAFALLLSLPRELNRVIPTSAGEQWQRDNYHPIELRGKTAVIVGVGGIGSQIAQRAHAFGMTVIGVDPKDMPLNPTSAGCCTRNRSIPCCR